MNQIICVLYMTSGCMHGAREWRDLVVAERSIRAKLDATFELMVIKYTSFDRVFQGELIGTSPVSGTSRSANQEVKKASEIVVLAGFDDVLA